MKLFKYYLVVFCVLALSGIAYAQARGKPIPANKKPNHACRMTQALGGDPEAAKLCAAMHLQGNQSLLYYWTQIAAENGDIVSQYNYAIILLIRNNKHDKIRAIYWLKKSSAKGYAPAKHVLDDIRLNPNSSIPIAPPPPSNS